MFCQFERNKKYWMLTIRKGKITSIVHNSKTFNKVNRQYREKWMLFSEQDFLKFLRYCDDNNIYSLLRLCNARTMKYMKSIDL